MIPRGGWAHIRQNLILLNVKPKQLGEAFEKVELLRPDLVLMDMVMPGINGLESAHIIKEREPDTYVIIWTLYAEAQTA